MKHFTFPFVSQKKHLAKTRRLDFEIQNLKEKLDKTNAELDKFRAAQRGECVPSQRCKNCEHGLDVLEHFGGYSYTNTVCGLILPQCPTYQKKEGS